LAGGGPHEKMRGAARHHRVAVHRQGESMSCYLRQLRPLFDELGLEYNKENRAKVDAAIREVVGARADARCPEVWSAVNALNPHDRADLSLIVAHRIR
jgi:hypothetical protein